MDLPGNFKKARGIIFLNNSLGTEVYPLRKYETGAAIQRRGSILAWTVILSVYGAVTIAIDLSLSALIS
jgi:hypothetical protein